MKKILNHIRIKFSAQSENEAFARIAAAGFIMNLNATPSQIADIKTVVSEAVTNSIVHGYKDSKEKQNYVVLDMKYYDDKNLIISIMDKGCGIADIEKAMEPFYTTDKEGERSGMGLPIMDAFSDSMKIRSEAGYTCVTMKKRLK